SDTAEESDVLFAIMRVRDGVADDARRRVELIEDLPCRLIGYLEPAVERAVENQTAIGGQWAAVDLEWFIDRPLGLSRHRVERVGIKRGEGRHAISSDLSLCKHTLVNAVIIPAIMRCHLIGPCSYSRIRIACKDGHRPFVVARPLRGIPGPRVSGPVVKEV